MKANFDIPAGLLDNGQLFQNDFFRRFTLRHAERPLKLTDTVSKDYLFPTFYGDVTCAIAIFLCSYQKAAELLSRELDPLVRPVRMPGGRSLVAFSCYEYKNVMGVAPYNEIAVAVPVMVNARFNPPLLPMILSSFRHFGYYIAAMPVTSHENTLRGNHIWGLPKVTRQIDMDREGNDCITTAREENGEPYLTIRVETDGSPSSFDVSSYLYTRLEGEFLRSRTCFQARFNVKKFMNLLFKKGQRPSREYIRIGNTPSAAVLRELEIEEHPFQFRYAEHMSSCFDLPETDTPGWMKAVHAR